MSKSDELKNKLDEADSTKQRLSRLYFAQVEENRRRAERVHRLFGTIAGINAERDAEKLLRDVVEAVRAHLGFRRVRLRLREPGASQLRVRVVAGPGGDSPAEFDRESVALEEFDRWLAASRRISASYLIGRNPLDDGAPANGGKPESGKEAPPESLEAWDWRDGERLVVPIRGRSGELAGCLSLDDPLDRLVPSRDGVELLEILANNVGIALDNIRLVSQLEAQAHDLEETHRRAQELHALKSTFLTGVSHEVRTALGSIRAYVEGLRSVREGELSFEQVRSFLETIHGESRRVVRLAESLIDLNRFDPGQFRHARVRFSLAEVVEDGLVTLRPLAESGQVTLKMQNAVADTGMEADRHQVQQLVLHLGRNALRFTPPGGSVTLRLSGDARDLMLEVEDTGVGIPEPQLETLFERFHPGPAVREGASSGLGLALCRSIVEWHGGHIYADSTPGMGSRFTVVLPRRCGPRVALRAANTGASATDEALRLAIEMVAEVMNARVVTLYAPDDGGALALRAATGLDEETVRKVSIAPGRGVAGWVAEHRRPACVSGPDVVPDGGRGNRTGSYLCVPLLAGTELLGVLAVTDPAGGTPFGAEDCHLLLELAARVTHAWEESRALERSQQNVEDTTRTLRLVLDHLERGRRIAPDRVPLARGLAQALDRSEAEVGLIGYAASIHDVGMSRMNERVLEGANPLTSEDRASLEKHPELGLEMLRPLDRLGAAREIVLGHHEWWDGSGYPRGLAGDRIPIGARILAVVDAWESMTVGRPHRTTLSADAALTELRARRGVQFDPAVVDVFEGVWRELDASRGKSGPANREVAPSDTRG